MKVLQLTPNENWKQNYEDPIRSEMSNAYDEELILVASSVCRKLLAVLYNNSLMLL